MIRGSEGDHHHHRGHTARLALDPKMTPVRSHVRAAGWLPAGLAALGSSGGDH